MGGGEARSGANEPGWGTQCDLRTSHTHMRRSDAEQAQAHVVQLMLQALCGGGDQGCSARLVCH
jgi:hypothetical protein